MPKDYSRTERLSEQLRRELSDLISRELKDPRVNGMISLTSVEVSRDLSHAQVYFTLLGGTATEAEVTDALSGASGFLRHSLGKRLKVRAIPQLHFHYDESVTRGAELESLINQVVAQDRLKHQDDEQS
ncbi:MAG: 30S ribosome-binding factor RbfA [Gammaproteobacteria bacterium]